MFPLHKLHTFFRQTFCAVCGYLPRTANIKIVQSVKLLIDVNYIATNIPTYCVYARVSVCVGEHPVTLMLCVNNSDLGQLKHLQQYACVFASVCTRLNLPAQFTLEGFAVVAVLGLV